MEAVWIEIMGILRATSRDSIQVRVVREGRELTIKATLAERK
jgi:hypothetical protein